MKKYPLLLLLLLMSANARAEALSGGRQISPETVAQLETMHREAEGLIATNDFRGAVRAYSDILLLEPDDETAYVNMGTCQLLLGEYKQAEQSYNNALTIDPENEAAMAGLHRIHDPDSARLDENETQEAREQVSLPPGWMLRKPEAAEPAPVAPPAPPVAVVTASPQPPQALLPAAERELPSAISLTGSERLQQALKNAGFYNGPIDGVIGPESRRAVQAFQAQNGLSVDGKAGPKTWAALKPYLSD